MFNMYDKKNVYMLFTPSPCYKLSHLFGPPSSVTYFMNGPQERLIRGASQQNTMPPRSKRIIVFKCLRKETKEAQVLLSQVARQLIPLQMTRIGRPCSLYGIY